MDLSMVEASDLARSLIREFFLKMGFSRSLEAFEAEDSRKRVKMTKIELIRLLSMERLVKNNKLAPMPQLTLIEIVAEYLNSRFRGRIPSGGADNSIISEIRSITETTNSNQNETMHSITLEGGGHRPPAQKPQRTNNNIDIDRPLIDRFKDIPQPIVRTSLSNCPPPPPPIYPRVNASLPPPAKPAAATVVSQQEVPSLESIISRPPFLKHSSSPPDQQQQEEKSGFKVESRRGNMRKTKASEDSRGWDSELFGGATISALAFSETKKKEEVEEQDSQNETTIDRGSTAGKPASGNSSNRALSSTDSASIFGEQISTSKLLQQERKPSSSSISAAKAALPPSSSSSAVAAAATSNNNKQFNFFGKKKQDSSEECENPTSSSSSQVTVPSRKMSSSNGVLDLDTLLDCKPAATPIEQTALSQQQHPSRLSNNRRKMRPFGDDDDDLDFSKTKQPPSSFPPQGGLDSTPAQSHAEGYISLDMFSPGSLSSLCSDICSASSVNFQKQIKSHANHSGGIKGQVQNPTTLSSLEVADIKKLLFNQAQNKYLPASWNQGFQLNTSEDNFFGLLQKEGGPCGVIACVQAFYLKYLFFVYPRSLQKSGGGGNDAPLSASDYSSQIVRENCLLSGLAEILFNCRNESGIIRLAIAYSSSSSPVQSISVEHCKVVSFKPSSLEQTIEMLVPYKNGFLQGSGVTTFLYSVVLTKTPERIRLEMDSPENSLIGTHGHCSQEQVNLFLTGKARTNCFDGEKLLDGDFKLTGIDDRSQFGFLTIFEHLGFIEVGSRLKTPVFPIWIICKEYHYSVIFAKDTVITDSPHSLPYFDLVYYDQLYNAGDRILLTITNKAIAKHPLVKNKQSQTSSSSTNFLFQRKKKENGEDDEDMIPLIELVLRTKWGQFIELDWNGTQPIL